MGRLRASLLALALGLTAAVALSACGGSGAKLLPGATASQINSNLDQVQELVSEGECIGAQNAAAAVGEQVEELSGVDAKLKQALQEGAARLNEVVTECKEAGPTGAEEQEALEGTEEQEALEAEADEEAKKTEKPAKEKNKPEKEVKEPKEEKEPSVEPEPPAQEEGGSVEPPAEEGGSSGGVGPGAPAGEG